MEITLRLRLLSYAVFCLLFLPFLGYSFDEKSPKKSRKNKESYSSPKDDLKPLPKLVLKSGNPVFLKNFFLEDENPKEVRPVKWVESNNTVDCIRYEIVTDKKIVKTGEEISVTVRLAFADGLPIAWRDEDCERLSIKVVFPKSFQQTGGNYFDFMPIRFDDNNKSFEITIKGIFLKPEVNGEFMLLKGPPTSNWETTFIKKKELYISATGKDLSNTIAKTTNRNIPTDISVKNSTPQYSVTDDCPTPTASGSTVCVGSTVNLIASGGATYSWVGPNSFISTEANVEIENATALNAGVYTVTVSGGTCTATATASVVVNALPSPTASATESTVCVGSSISLTSFGGTSYSWSGPASFSSSTQNPTINNATLGMAGVYTVTVTNVNDCSATATTSITVNTLPTSSITVTNATVCQGATIEMSGSGGTSYTWVGPNSFSSSDEEVSITNASSLMDGVYTVTVENNSGCTATATASINVNVITPPVIEASLAEICLAESPMSVTLTATGCNGGTVLWNTTETGTSIQVSPLITGTYSATCQLSSCTSLSSNVISITVKNRPPAPTISANKTILQNNETATLTATGCSGTISWSNGMSGSSIGLTTNSVLTITATCALNGCVSTNSNTITLTPCGSYKPTISANLTDVTACTNVTFTAGNLTGQTGYTLNWRFYYEDGSEAFWSPTGYNVSSIIWSMRGTYDVRVQSVLANNCISLSDPIHINVANGNPKPIIIADKLAICNSGSFNLSSSCPNGVIKWYNQSNILMGSGNTYQTPSYTLETNETSKSFIYSARCVNSVNCVSEATNITLWYEKTPETPILTSSKIDICSGQSITLTASNLFNNDNNLVRKLEWWDGSTSSYVYYIPTTATKTLSPTSSNGFYVKSVTYFGCTSPASNIVFVNVSNTAPTTQSITASATSICEGSSENITLTSSTCDGTVNWSWTNSAGSSGTVNSIGDLVVSGLTSTTTYKSKCTNGCGTSASWSPTVTITVIPKPIISGVSASVNACLGGNINLTASGGTTYSWAGPESFSSSSQNSTITNATSAMAGVYTVTVTNANNCSATATTNVTVNALPTPTASATASAVCVGSNINLTASGGTSYSWAGPESFSSSSQNSTINNAISAMAGVYTVTVTNANNCSATATTSITINSLPTASITVTNSTVCQGATIEMNGNGGTSYSWIGPNSFSSSDEEISISNASALMTGIYTLAVENSSGCLATATVSITVTVITPPTIETSAVEICLTETPTFATLTATGCTSGTVLWSTSETGTSIQVSPLITGTYSATCQIGGCGSLPSNVIELTVKNRPPAPTISANKTVLVANETATLTATGCSGTVSWSNGMTGSSIGVTTNSTITITATCALNDCVSNNSNSITLTACTPPTITGVTASISICFGAPINLTATGGNTYSWAGPNGYTSTAQNPTISTSTFIMAGTYTVTVTNTEGCSGTATTNVIVKPLPTATANSTNANVCQGGTIQLTATGGGTYLWSGPGGFSGTTSSVNITHATIPMSGTYTVTVTNANNCSATATTNISVANVLTVSATGSTVCTNTTATVLATGGSTYAWIGPNGFSASGQTVNINNASLSAAGVYTVTVSNVNNCTATATAMVIINPVGSTQTITASKISVCTKSNENITLTSTVCTGTVNWQWTSSAGSGTAVGNPITISNLSADVTYKSKCTNNCGISTDWSDPVTITLLAAPVITSISSNTPIINEGDPINFALIVTNAESYSWAGPHSFTSTLQNPTVTGTTEENTGIYTITVTSSSGCTVTATTFVEVNKDCKCTTCGTDGEGLSTINPTANPDFTIPSELQARNFIVENTYLDEVDHTKVVQNVSYMDGLGRGNQNIRRGVGGQGEDIVSVTEYDNFGRETKKYLPYPIAGTNGYYVEGAASGIANYYQALKGDNHVYAETEFEGSALQRVKKQGNVGVAWQLDATTPHVISFDYRANTTADAVMSLNYDFDTKKLKIVAAAYPAGELTVTITTNENGQIAREFKNREGQVICKDEATNDAANTTRTYYVFDDLGLLRFVITPKAETELKTRAVSSLININPNGGDFFLKNQVYYYDYDANGLLIESAVPGMQVVKQMIYNKRDQLVLTVGANTFNPDNRIYNKYDDLNRLVSSGLYTGNESVETMRTSAAGNTTWPTSNLTEYLRNYYDNLTTNNYPSGEQVAFSTSGYNSSYSSDLQGKLVGTKTKIFSYAGHILTSTSNSVKRIELLSTNYYDDEGRLIQVASKNHKDGLDYTHKKFDFIGREIASKTTTEFKHWTNSTTSTTQTKIIETKSTFDAGSRIKSICQKNDSDAWEPVQRNNYNGIGELSSKLQGCSIQKVDYTYNMRGWLTDINDLSGFSAQATSSNPDLFAMHLDYNGTGQYLGNITGQQWRTLKKQNATPSTQETYTYTYDNLNRLLTGTYTGERGGLSTEIYGTTPYDKIGNIQKLKRTKITDVNTVVDDLTYTYYAGSVTLQKITDSGDKNSFFKEPDNNNNDYTYDFNGNLSVDKNKYYEYSNGAGGINHNALGLLARLSSNNSNPDAGAQVTVRNYYTGRGEKIRSEIASIESGEAVLKSTDYIAGLIWTNNSTVTSTPAVLDFIPTAEGRVVLTSSIYGSVTPPEGLPLHRYEYHLKDHLGNLRAAYRCGDPKRDTEGNILTESEAGIEQVTLVQEIHYDPLGATFGNEAETQIPATLSQRWQYYGKEKVTEAGLNWLDFGARFYDPIIGRWHAASNANNQEALSPYYFSHTPARLDATYKLNNSIKKVKDFAKWRKAVSSVYN